MKSLEEAWKCLEEALELLDKADWLPNAAEKAWIATEKAIRVLIMASKKKAPELLESVIRELEKIEKEDKEVKKMNILKRFLNRLILLHGSCFYGGICEPREEVIRLIVETKDLLYDVKRIIRERGLCFTDY